MRRRFLPKERLIRFLIIVQILLEGLLRLELNKIKNLRINNFPLLLFFNAKSDEITEIFSAGKPFDNVQKVKETLESLAPLYFEKWQKIK